MNVEDICAYNSFIEIYSSLAGIKIGYLNKLVDGEKISRDEAGRRVSIADKTARSDVENTINNKPFQFSKLSLEDMLLYRALSSGYASLAGIGSGYVEYLVSHYGVQAEKAKKRVIEIEQKACAQVNEVQNKFINEEGEESK